MADELGNLNWRKTFTTEEYKDFHITRHIRRTIADLLEFIQTMDYPIDIKLVFKRDEKDREAFFKCFYLENQPEFEGNDKGQDTER